jgi:glycosyltransferase involved in cell wall biosynthesis
MINQPLVSIIIPTFNRASTIERAIRSALNQTYTNIEIIVVDNCSTDNSNRIIKKLQSEFDVIKYSINSSNIGPVRNWLECVKQSSGEYIKILFSDDELEHDWIEKSINIFLEYKDIGFVYTPALIINQTFNGLSYNYFDHSKILYADDYIFLNYFYLSMPVSPCCAIFRKSDVITSLVKEIPNPFNLVYSNTGAGNDLLLYLKVASSYPKVYFLKDTRVKFYGGTDSLTMSNNLTLNYEFTKIHFLNQYKKLSLLYFIKLQFSSNRHLSKYLNCKFSFQDLGRLFKFFYFKNK